MASNINPSKINSFFPVPGKDNDTQGFRDNFAAIVSALTTASTEISLIQSTYASNAGNNDFNGHQLHNAIVSNTRELVQAHPAPINGVTVVDYLAGGYQTYIVDPALSTTFTVINWPTSGCATIKLQVTASTSTPATSVIHFTPAMGSTMYTVSPTVNPYSLATTSTTVFDIMSPNGGTAQFLSTMGGFYANV